MLEDRERFSQTLASWFKHEGRQDLPWRTTRDPYAILVSEVMLQQTQVVTVLSRGYYTNWLEKFPDVATLAAAKEEEVLKMWEGLGYYSRARNLQKAAQAVIENHDGIFPTSPEEVRALPGVGRYTAGAVCCFALGLPEPIVDANVARVLARLMDFHQPVDSTSGIKQLWEWATECVPETDSYHYNSGLMELGQRICKPKAPDCGICPVKNWCTCDSPEKLPIKKERRKTIHRDEHSLYAVSEGKILLHREPERRRQGLWRLPERTSNEIAGLPLAAKMKYSITHYRVTLHVYEITGAKAREDEAWHSLESLASLPMPSPYRRALETVQESFLLQP